jgi:PEP-CTERM motif
LACFISVLSASAANLLIDPSFELNTAASAGGWNIVNGGVRSTGAWDQPPATGGHAIRLPPGTSTPLCYQGPKNAALTNITAGMQFELTAYGLITNSITSGSAFIQISFFDANGVGVGPAMLSNKIDSNTPPAMITSVGNLPANGTWIFLDTGVVTAPTGTAYMDVYGISVNVVGGSTWEDNFDLEAVPEPSTFMLAGFGLIALFAAARRRRQA